MSRTVLLPSGARVRGRPLGEAPATPADFLLALASGPLPPWPHRRIAWPDFWLPLDRRDALDGLGEVLHRASLGEVVEVACRGGRGRTGTALAALAVLDGIPPREAVGWVRRHYHPKAVEMPWQAWWVRTLAPAPGPGRWPRPLAELVEMADDRNPEARPRGRAGRRLRGER